MISNPCVVDRSSCQLCVNREGQPENRLTVSSRLFISGVCCWLAPNFNVWSVFCQHTQPPPSAWWKFVTRSPASGPILAEWCILGAGAPGQGPPSIYYGHHLQRLCRLSSSVVILPCTNRKTDCCALGCTLLISERKLHFTLFCTKSMMFLKSKSS